MLLYAHRLSESVPLDIASENERGWCGGDRQGNTAMRLEQIRLVLSGGRTRWVLSGGRMHWVLSGGRMQTADALRNRAADIVVVSRAG